MKVDQEGRMTIKHLTEDKKYSCREVARLLGVNESTVRYHLRRQAAGIVDGRSNQRQLAEDWHEAISHYLASADGDDAPINLAGLHDYLVCEHGYPGSLRSVQRYYNKHFPKPRRRARRRVETPPGAQAQVDWDEYSRLVIGGQVVKGYRFHMKLSFSRKAATVWSPRKDALSWIWVHNEAFRRLGGIPASVRVDNTKTAVSRGAGPWGEIAPAYRRYARAMRFHVDACLPRSPEHKGKVERNILDHQQTSDVRLRDWNGWDKLQIHSDAIDDQLAQKRICPATGTTVAEAWLEELPFLGEIPPLPEPFDLVVTRRVGRDCTVGFEGRRYSVPFELLGRQVEVRGCARMVQVVHDGAVVAEHPRGSRERILITPAHYQGEATADVLPPMPLGRMGKKLQQIAEMSPAQRPLDLYAALAEVAR
jgi:transposase